MGTATPVGLGRVFMTDIAALIDVDSIPPHAVHGGGIKPIVQVGPLEELLTGSTFDKIREMLSRIDLPIEKTTNNFVLAMIS